MCVGPVTRKYGPACDVCQSALGQRKLLVQTNRSVVSQPINCDLTETRRIAGEIIYQPEDIKTIEPFLGRNHLKRGRRIPVGVARLLYTGRSETWQTTINNLLTCSIPSVCKLHDHWGVRAGSYWVACFIVDCAVSSTSLAGERSVVYVSTPNHIGVGI